MNKVILGEAEKLKKRSFDKQRTCYHPGCQNVAINSHLLQKRGILNRLTSNDCNCIYEIEYSPFLSDQFKFKCNGLSKSLTFKGFCSEHDFELFKPIEKENTILNSYLGNLLLAYRALLNEKRKKEIMIDWYKSLLNSSRTELVNSHPQLHDSIKHFELGVRDNQNLKEKIEEDLNEPSSRSFIFFERNLPYFEICTSAVFSYESIKETHYLTRNFPDEPLTTFLINIVPEKDYLYVSIGCHLNGKEKIDEYKDYWATLSDEEGLKELSDILLLNIETWACSPKFYLEYLKAREREIFSIIRDSVNLNFRDTKINFNIFKQ